MGLNLIWSTIVWIIIIGGFSLFFRKKIANILNKVPLQNFIIFLIVGILYSIVEENINCPASGCVLIPYTIPVFFLFLVILLVIIKLCKVRNFYIGILIFGIIGWIAEFFFGTSKIILWSSPWIFLIMSAWTISTYSVILIIPMTIFLEDKA